MKTNLVIGMAMAAALSVRAGECNVAVYVHSSFPMSSTALSTAELRASAMFREIGVDMRWKEGGARAAAVHASCGIPIMVEIESFAGPQFPKDALAYAHPYSESGTRIHVFMNRIADSRRPQFTIVLLAYVLAHEITHVLERVNRHSEEGVLKAHWNSQDFFLMQSKGLRFDPMDVALIHDAIVKRVQPTATE
jgi:hypothetical protein